VVSLGDDDVAESAGGSVDTGGGSTDTAR
jgi:hypothetical protein